MILGRRSCTHAGLHSRCSDLGHPLLSDLDAADSGDLVFNEESPLISWLEVVPINRVNVRFVHPAHHLREVVAA